MENREEVRSTDVDIQLVAFQLGSEEYGVEIEWIREIIRLPHITHIPESESFIEGVINLRGEVIAVADLAKLFSLEHQNTDLSKRRIIVVEVEEKKFGILVDAVPEVIRLPKDHIEETPAIITTKLKKHVLKGVGKLDGRLLVLLDMKKLISDEHFQALGNTPNAELTETKQSA